MANSYVSGMEDVRIDWKGHPYPGVYKATRRKDGWLYCEVRFGMMKTRKYFPPEEVEFMHDIEHVYIDKVTQDGQVQRV